jgi:hypothetical protein
MVIATQFMVVPVFQYAGVMGVMLVLVSFLALATIAVAFFGESTNNRSLEELDPLTESSGRDPVREQQAAMGARMAGIGTS